MVGTVVKKKDKMPSRLVFLPVQLHCNLLVHILSTNTRCAAVFAINMYPLKMPALFGSRRKPYY